MTNSDREAIRKLTERLQNAQAELRIVADRGDNHCLEMANNKLLVAIQWMQEASDQ